MTMAAVRRIHVVLSPSDINHISRGLTVLSMPTAIFHCKNGGEL